MPEIIPQNQRKTVLKTRVPYGISERTHEGIDQLRFPRLAWWFGRNAVTHRHRLSSPENYGALLQADKRGLLSSKHKAHLKKLHKEYYPTIQEENKRKPNMTAASLASAGLLGTGMAGSYLTAMPSKEMEAKLEEVGSRHGVKPTLLVIPEDFKIPFTTKRIKIPIAAGLVTAMYDPIRNVIFTPRSEAVALHEMGHAVDYSKGKLLKIIARAGPAAVAASLINPDLRKSLAGTKKKSLRHKAVSGIEAAPAVLGLGMLPTLWQEAKASRFALKEMHRAGGRAAVVKGLASLAPAFGTYLTASLAGAYGAHKLIRMQQKLQEMKRQGKLKHV